MASIAGGRGLGGLAVGNTVQQKAEVGNSAAGTGRSVGNTVQHWRGCQ